MKKILILAVTAVGAVSMTSCGVGSARLTSDTDSLAYAIGVDVASNIYRFDSTLNVNILMSAFKDVYSKKAKMTPEEAQAYTQEYMSVILPNKNKEIGQKFVNEAIEAGATKTESGLAYTIQKEGEGPKAQIGDSVVVSYVLSFPDGRVVEDAADRETTFLLEDGRLIPAWIEGMQLLNPGSKATLYIPGELGYGAFGMQGSPIGPNQALKFDVELKRVVPGEKKTEE